MSIQQNFPAISPSLNLNFARSKTLDPRITFSRTTTATRVNEQGLVEVVSADIPRFDHEYDASTGVVKSLGLLVEEQRTNFILNSNLPAGDEASGQSTITVSTVSGVITPDGNSSTVRRLQYAANAAYRFGDTSSGTAGLSYTGSVWARAVSGSAYISLDVNDRGGIGYTIGEEWQRLSTTGSRNDVNYRFFDLTGQNQDIYIWGIQLEEGAFLTSYIPTDGTIGGKTRNPDNVSITGDNFSDWYNQSEGTLYANFKGGRDSNPAGDYGTVVAHSNTYVMLSLGNSESKLLGYFQYPGPPTSVTLTIPNSDYVEVGGDICVSYDLTSTTLVKGSLQSTESINPASSVNPVTFWKLGSSSEANNRYLNGTISQLTYYPRRLTNTQLQNLTK